MKRPKIVPLNRLANTAKIKRIINVVTELVMMSVAAGFAIYFMVIHDPHNRLFACLGTFVAFGAPLAVELIRGRRLTFVQHILLEAYMFFTMFLGSVLYLHHTFAPFDEISHALFGYFSCIAIFYWYISSNALSKLNCTATVFLMFMISMGTSAVWEVLEFGMDVFFGEHSMGFPPQDIAKVIDGLGLGGIAANLESLKNTCVMDTATDMALHAAGAAVFIAQYLIHRLGRKNVLLGSMQRETLKDEMNTDKSPLEPPWEIEDTD